MFGKIKVFILQKSKLGQIKNEHEDDDPLQSLMGSFGKYQVYLFVILVFSKIIAAFHLFSIVFIAPKITYICPYTNTSSCPCDNPVFTDDIFTNTIIKEWELICERKWLIGFTQTMFQFGNLLGSALFGAASDKFGRRNTLILACAVQMLAGCALPYMPTFWLFTTFRTILGMSVGGTLILSFVILMEFIGPEYRETFSALYHSFFNIGQMLLPVISYYCRDYKVLQQALSAASLVMIIYIFLLPESPRWMLSAHKTDNCIKLVVRVAKLNKLPSECIRAKIQQNQSKYEESGQKRNFLDLFRTTNIRKNIIIMSLMWMTCGYCFYGVAQFTGFLGGDIFTNMGISAGVTYIGCLASIPLMRIFERKTLFISMSFVCSLCLFLLTVCRGTVYSVVFAIIGTVCSYDAFIIVYLQANEIFPTVVRSAAVGISSMMARLGSMIAPFVVLLEDVNPWLSPVLFAIPPLLAGFLSFLLPETKGCKLMTTLEEGEELSNEKQNAAQLTKL